MSDSPSVLGLGGASRVVVESDPDLERDVARKILAVKELGPDDVMRFRLEARMTARLEHPNIVPVYSFGVDGGGTPWFTMRRLHGNLNERLRGDPCARSPDELYALLEIFSKVCDAVAYAHHNGVVHRDIKPHNVAVGQYGEVYLIDWGSGMLLQGPRAPDGEIFGTPGYMSPEQAHGRISEIDERTDVFGLGALLYHLLTSRPPYSGKTTRQVLGYARNTLFADPSVVLGTNVIPRELERICLTALRADKAERYQSVVELRDDLARFVRSAWNFRTEEFPEGSEIIRQGDLGTEAFIIKSGMCDVIIEAGDRCDVVHTLRAGDVFGEVGAITRLPRTATIRAREHVTVYVISFEDMQNKLGLDTWSGRLVRTLAARFRDVDAERTVLQRRVEAQNAELRLLSLIASRGGPLTWTEALARLHPVFGRTDAELAQMLGGSLHIVVDVAADRVSLRTGDPVTGLH